MTAYVKPTVTKGNFTAGKLYKVQHVFSRDRVIVIDDAKEEVIVRVDGELSSRLDWAGKFERVNLPDQNQAVAYSLRMGIANTPKKDDHDRIREIVRDIAAQTIRDGRGWRIKKDGVSIQSSNFVPAEQILMVDGKKYKASELVQAAKDLEAVRKALRTPDGYDVIQQAKAMRILADTTINLVK